MKDELVPAPRALQMVLENAAPEASEMVGLHEAHGRVLAANLEALRTQPPFDASAMDGYGVRQEDITTLPALLAIIGQSAAGHPYSGKVSRGQAVRIFTGAPVPKGVDTIVIQENTTARDGHVKVLKEAKRGRYIRNAGLDFKQGQTLLQRGRVLDAQCVALAASMNHAHVEVWRKPLVAILATGDELVAPGNTLEKGQIIASNSFGLFAMAQKSGAQAIDLGIAQDTLEGLTTRVETAIAKGADMIVTMGGASVGDHDLVYGAMEKIGFNFAFTKIAMRPGKPFLFATKTHNGKTIRMLGLAGNPVSSIVAGQVFVRPLINALAGLPPQSANPVKAILGSALPANDQRQEYMRATCQTNAQGRLVATPFDSQDSSMLANLTRADCLLIRPINAPAAMAGDGCEVVMLR